MTGQYGQSAYQETGVLSTSPERLVPLLYQHLSVNLKRGALCIHKGDIDGKYENLTRASDIVAELLSALDFEAGGELAGRLASLYSFWSGEISKAGREMNPKRIEQVTGMVESLRETWEEAARMIEAEQAQVGSVQ
jgi:flagellar secretion chaperone FliS